MDDLRAVMDAVGSQHAAVYGGSEGGALSVLFTTTYPERVSALVLYGAYPRMAWAPDYPDGVPEEMSGLRSAAPRGELGPRTEGGLPLWALTPDRVDDPAWRKAHGRWERLSASPGAAVALQQMVPRWTCATSCRRSACRLSLCIGRRTSCTRWAAATWVRTSLAPRSSNFRAVTLPVPRGPGCDPRRDRGVPHRRSSGARAGSRSGDSAVHRHRLVDGARRRVGDDAWTRTLDRHDALVAREVERHRGRRINTTGDGIARDLRRPGACVCGARKRSARGAAAGHRSASGTSHR